jgi:hypothetical protein
MGIVLVHEYITMTTTYNRKETEIQQHDLI